MNYTTKNLIEKATKMPENYALCFNTDCPLSSQCLRAIEAKKQDGSNLYIRIVNPFNTKKDENGQCPAYRDSTRTITYAIGFHKRMTEINNDTRRVYRDLHTIFRNTHYYDMLNGNTLITPEEQEIIRSTAERYGYEFPEDAFDIIVVGKVW